MSQPAEGGEVPDEEKKLDRDSAAAAKSLNMLTDKVEERELDASKVQLAMAAIAATQKADKEAQRLRDKELAAVKVSPADVDIISIEFEITKKQADLRLREHKGDVRAALESYL